MKVTVESTTKIVTLEVNGASVPARVWQGTTARGTPVFCFLTRISPAILSHDLTEEQVREFERDLEECAAPSVPVAAIPLRMIL